MDDHGISNATASISAPTTETEGGCSNSIVSPSTDLTQYTSQGAIVKLVVLPLAARTVNNGTAKLREFSQVTIPAAVYERFEDLQHLLKHELVKCITPMTAPSNVGWELKVVGISETTAVPAMVFTAKKKVAKNIRQFFKEKHTRDILGTGDPPISVHVLSIPHRH
jgi:hypothetical protein